MHSNRMIKASALFTALALFGCAHGTMRGSVAMKTSEREAHVCLGDKEAKVGDRVAAFINSCPSKGGLAQGGPGLTCEKQRIGEGTVTKLINEHYSVVEFDEGVKFSEGTFVEKM